MKLFFSRPNRTQMCADYQDFKYKKLTEKIPAISQSPETVGEYFADILVDKKVIVEIKVARYLVEDNEARY